jgi:ABC-type uncharacterized transport system auxiliary subunit
MNHKITEQGGAVIVALEGDVDLQSSPDARKVPDLVVTPEMRANPDYVLTGKIKRLEKINGLPPKTLLEIELGLREASGGKIIFLDAYSMETKSDGAGVSAAVQSLDKVVDGYL